MSLAQAFVLYHVSCHAVCVNMHSLQLHVPYGTALRILLLTISAGFGD